MKKKIIILLLIICDFHLVDGQIIKSIGIKSGISLSNQSWDYSLFYMYLSVHDSKGFYGVATADFINKKNWDLSADLGYYQSCSKAIQDQAITHDLSPDLKNKFGFITFSPNIRLKTNFKSFTPYFIIGPRFDFYSSDLSNKNANSHFNEINKILFGLSAGLGINYNINNIALIAEYQYLYTFTNIIDQAALLPIPQENITRDVVRMNNHIISLGIKYYFNKEEL